MNLYEYVGQVTIFSCMFTTASCLVAGLALGLGLGLDEVSGCAHTHVFVLLSNVTVTLPWRHA